jgi:hypothetical protein
MLHEVMAKKNKMISSSNKLGELRNTVRAFGKTASAVKKLGDNSRVITK